MAILLYLTLHVIVSESSVSLFCWNIYCLKLKSLEVMLVCDISFILIEFIDLNSLIKQVENIFNKYCPLDWSYKNEEL